MDDIKWIYSFSLSIVLIWFYCTLISKYYILFVVAVDLLEMETDHDLVIVMVTVVGQEVHQANLVVRKVEHQLITSLPSG